MAAYCWMDDFNWDSFYRPTESRRLSRPGPLNVRRDIMGNMKTGGQGIVTKGRIACHDFIED